jgi:hypothetical protein
VHGKTDHAESRISAFELMCASLPVTAAAVLPIVVSMR